MDGNKIRELTDRILAKTQEGAWSEWRDRIAALAAVVGVNLAHLQVAHNAVHQAHEVVMEVKRRDLVDRLEEVLTPRECDGSTQIS